MKQKNYEHPSMEIELFYADIVMVSDPSLITDDWDDYQGNDQLF
jgi:hypothetical protein